MRFSTFQFRSATFLAGALFLLIEYGAHAADLMTLSPVFTDQLGNSLGPSSLNKASEYFEILTEKWGYPSVRPIYKDGSAAITNLPDLVPAELIIVPRMLTIRTSQTRGSLYDEGRKKGSGGIPAKTSTNPANDSVFVYALNKDRKLIYPLAMNPNGSGFVPTYEILSFGNHFNQEPNSQPIVAAIDVDDALGGGGGYDPANPMKNPPWALMVRARTPGKYQIHVVARVNSMLVPDSLPQKDSILSSVVGSDIEINAVDGPELIDGLIVRGTAPKQTCISNNGPCLNLLAGESIDLTAIGRVDVRQWDDAAKKYSFLNHREIALQRITWRYDETPMANPNPAIQECIFLTSLSADGAAIRLTAGNFQPAPSLCGGILRIEGHGRMFEIPVRVYK